MAKTPEQEQALSDYAQAVARHVLTAMEARENTDVGFQQALDESFNRLNACRKRLRALGITPIF
jgi:gamma-glutamyl:cysteine ligase YbdK (ATP-grasp superfamily)